MEMEWNQRFQSKTSVFFEVNLDKETFLPGEVFTCKISLQNRSNSPQTLEWCTVQIGGYYRVDVSWIKLMNDSNAKKLEDSSGTVKLTHAHTTGDNIRCIFCSPSTLIASNLTLLPQTTYAYILRCMLPYGLYNSGDLVGVKYRYQVSIQGHQIKGSYIPFRILNPATALKKVVVPTNAFLNFSYNMFLTPLQEDDVKGYSVGNNGTTIGKTPLTPVSIPRSPSESQMSSRRILISSPPTQQLLTEQHNSKSALKSVHAIFDENSKAVCMNINKAEKHLVTLCLLGGTAYHLGQQIKGTFDFTGSEVKCFQISIRLDREDTLDSAVVNPIRGNRPISKTIAEHHELSLNTLSSLFSFHIPVGAPPQMSTELISVRWVLRFEFMTSSLSSAQQPVECLKWNLPIQILVDELPHEPIYRSKNFIPLLQ